MGAATALRGASLDPRIEALVLEALYADLRAAVAAVLRRMRVPGSIAPLILLRARRLAGVALDRPRPIDLAPRVEAAALVVHGSPTRSSPSTAPASWPRRSAATWDEPPGSSRSPGGGHANVFGVGGDA